jgi:hypothetical protein
MKFAFHKLSILTLGLAALAIAQPASASYSETLDFGSSSSLISTLTMPPGSATLSFHQFNTTMGTLTGVTITLNDYTSVVCQATNNTDSQESFSKFYYTGTVAVLGPDGTTTSTSLSTSSDNSGNVTAFSVITVDSTENASLTSGPTSVTSISSYEGSGAGTFNLTVTPNNSFGGSGSAAVGGYTSTYGSVTITYEYTPNVVPEPASMAMVAIGLGGLAIAHRFRRRKV